MEVEELALSGLKRIKLKTFQDQRGLFFESYRKDFCSSFGLPSFVQDNVSFSFQNVLRGLHLQTDPAQAKLVSCLQGEIWDVAVDLRENSPTYKQWIALPLSDQNRHLLYIPEGFAHGFCVLSKTALVQYKVSSFYAPQTERGIFWNDPELKIEWPIESPILSEKDQANQLLYKV